MEQEQLYLSMLQQATGYSMAGGQLIIPTTSGVLVYSSTPPVEHTTGYPGFPAGEPQVVPQSHAATTTPSLAASRPPTLPPTAR